MSEFSDKLSEYIVKSGSNVYQLAKEASLDRTTLQKTAKGQRLPSLDYIREICQYIKYPVIRKRNWFVSIRLKSWDTVQ